MSVKKKSKAFYAAREGPLATNRLVIDLNSSKGKKDEAARYEPMTSCHAEDS